MKVSNIYELHDIYMTCSGATTDSRSVRPGEMFFALKGENFDGNRFAAAALQSGAAYAVVSVPATEDDDRYIVVDDVLKTMQELARAHRAYYAVMQNGNPLPVIALTGTNGKTTTKELVNAVLSARYNVLATEGNLNNHIGVPLTLLRMKPEHDMAVVEMGASAPGEIMELCRIALPNYGLITNVGKAHLLGFGSFEGVKKTKGELYDYIQRTADTVFVNVDNPNLREMASLRPDLITVPYGLEYSGATARQEGDFLSIVLADGNEIHTSLVGIYNADNVMAALAIGRYFSVPQDAAIAAIEAYVPSNKRSQLVKISGVTYIVDAYNANPTSMAAALDNIASMAVPSKAVMLGDMLELGEESLREHLDIIIRLSGMDLAEVYLAGSEFASAMNTEEARSAIAKTKTEFRLFGNSADMSSYLDEHPVSASVVLVKGSRGMRMENIFNNR